MKKLILIILSIITFASAVYVGNELIFIITLEQGYLIGYLLLALILTVSFIYTISSIQLNQKNKTLENRLELWQKLSYHVNQVGDEIFNQLPIGMIALDESFDIKWSNPYAKKMFSSRMISKPIADISDVIFKQMKSESLRFEFSLGSDVYDVWYKKELGFLYFFLITEQYLIKKKYKEQLPTMLVMSLDYIDESLSSLPVSEQSTLKGQYLGAIADWANQYQAYLQQLADDRIIAFSTRVQLIQMVQNEFTLLENIRKISEKHNVRVTLSMGVASWDTTYEALGVYAQNAIDLAEKRGGDQVVVNIENEKIKYFGAVQDAQSKNSRIDARIYAQTMKQMITNSDQVIIIGHKRADLDAFGAMAGVYAMSKSLQTKTFMYVPDEDLDPTAHKVFIDLSTKINDIATWRISQEDLKTTKDTVVIICDTQLSSLVIDKNILVSEDKMIIIDHHRAQADSIKAAVSYIEPYASSTVELVMDLMMFFETKETFKIEPLIASVMYGGMIVDTNHFANRTGTRTFEAAAKLREFGADTTLVNKWLKQDLELVRFINAQISEAQVIEHKFIITTYDDIVSDPVVLAQVANQALNIEGIEAAFSIGKISESRSRVSARSHGDLNVQFFMESFNGGGHLTSAATELEKSPIDIASEIISKLQLEYGGNEGNMKVILLEDVKGRGKKDEVIEVASGYAQFLLTQNKAVKASDDNISALEQKRKDELLQAQHHLEIMKSLKAEIDHKHITLPIQVGKDGKFFGAITTKHIVEMFEKKHGLLLDKKKIEVSSEINSVGIYTVTVHLHKSVNAQFEVHVENQKVN